LANLVVLNAVQLGKEASIKDGIGGKVDKRVRRRRHVLSHRLRGDDVVAKKISKGMKKRK
jgi:hypothetical protein